MKPQVQAVKSNFFDNFMNAFYKSKNIPKKEIIIHNSKPLKVIFKQ